MATRGAVREMTDIDLDAPWQPANARPFVAGDRVRLRLSRECPAHGRFWDQSRYDEVDGGTGKIIRGTSKEVQATRQAYPDHPLCLLLDKPFRSLRRVLYQGMLVAPSELEHLDAP